MKGASDPRLIRLSDTTLTLERPGEDIRNRKVIDANGNDVGKVEDLFIDEQERKVRFILVQAGGFLGLGGQHFLIPIDGVTEVNDEYVKIGHSREHVAGAPQYDPDLVEEGHYAAIYGYYGYGPFWGPGYMYPSYPFVGGQP